MRLLSRPRLTPCTLVAAALAGACRPVDAAKAAAPAAAQASVPAAPRLDSITVTTLPDSLGNGSVAYVPTRLDWLEHEAQAQIDQLFDLDRDGVAVEYYGHPPRVVRIVVQYRDRVTAGAVDEAARLARFRLESTARSHHWNTWLRVWPCRQAVHGQMKWDEEQCEQEPPNY